jgi:hypothetical protein
LSVTFYSDSSSEHTASHLIHPTHPLLRQAVAGLAPAEGAQCSLAVADAELPEGSHPFVIYRWDLKGVRPDQEFIAVAEDSRVREKLLDRIVDAATGEAPPPAPAIFDALDHQHHALWRDALAAHIEQNRQLVEHRLHSLRTSHAARIAVLRDLIGRAADSPRIRLMKEAELKRAEADFQNRLRDLENARESGDIHASPVVFGVLTIHRNKP